MTDVPYLLRGLSRMETESSALISSSKYLNDPRMREWITNITLKKNGLDTPPQSEMYDLIDILNRLRDKERIEELFTQERARNPALDAWFNEWFISDYDKEYFKQFAPETLGHIFYRDVIAKNFEIVITEKPEPKTQLDLFLFRAGQVHDLEHIITGGDFSYMGELVPAWARITNQFRHLDLELAGELSAMYLFVTLRYSVRTLLHYPAVFPACQYAMERGMRVGKNSGPFFLAKYEDLFPLSLEDARKTLDVQGAEYVDLAGLSEFWAGRAPFPASV